MPVLLESKFDEEMNGHPRDRQMHDINNCHSAFCASALFICGGIHHEQVRQEPQSETSAEMLTSSLTSERLIGGEGFETLSGDGDGGLECSLESRPE